MNDVHDALALTLWIMSELLGEFFQTICYVFPLLGVLFFINLVFLWIFHRKASGWLEILVFSYINGNIIASENKFRRFFWECVHKLAREYYWLRSKIK